MRELCAKVLIATMQFAEGTMPGMKDEDLQVRAIWPSELALLVTMHRQGLGWTQETLAEISGLTARTIQRVENGEPSSVDTKRALARAFKIEDVDAFNKPHAFSSPEKLCKFYAT